MLPASPLPSSSYLDTPPLRERLTGGLGALIVTALLLLIMLTLAPPFDRKEPATSGLSSFGLLPDAAPKPSTAKTPQKQRQKMKAARAVTKPVQRPQQPRVDTSAWPAGMIELNRKDFARSDIATLPTREKSQETADAGEKGAGAGSTDGTGSGSGGVGYYEAQLLRTPTGAELAFYMPKIPPPHGWGEVGCKMMTRNSVEDCHILGEYPAGSGYGRTVLNSAWQWKVLPPRLGNRQLIGLPVRIRITFDFTDGEVTTRQR